MAEKPAEIGSQGRLLFVGPLLNGGAELLENLEALGVHSERAADFEKAEKRLSDFDFILFAATDRADIARLRKLRETGKVFGHG